MSAELQALQDKYVEQIQSLNQLLENNEISEGEHKELVEDVLNVDVALKELNKQSIAIDVAKFIEGVKLAASLI